MGRRQTTTSPSPLDRFASRSHPLLGPRPNFSARRKWEELAGLIDRSAQVIRIAAARDAGPPAGPLEDQALWQPATKAVMEAIQVEHRTRVITQSFGIEP